MRLDFFAACAAAIVAGEPLGCSIDLHPRVFGVGDCAQTVLAHAPVVVWRRESDFWILVRASFAGHLAAWLADSALEFTVGNRERSHIALRN